MAKRFDGKTALVVGGAGGIGGEIVMGLLRDGATVMVGDFDQAGLDSMAERYKEGAGGIDLEGKLFGCRVNVTKDEDVEALLAETEKVLGHLDLAFNVAGSSKCGTIEEGKVEDYDYTVDICMKGVYLCMRHEIRAMRRNGGGNILNISSVNAWAPMWGDAAYSSAKNAVITLTQTCTVENSKYNIRCNAVLPGLTQTKMMAGWIAVPEIAKAFRDRIPMHRFAEPREIAAAALWLNSDDASFVNGTYLNVDGGWSSAGYPDFIEVLENDHSLWEV